MAVNVDCVFEIIKKYKLLILIFWPLLSLCVAYWALDLNNYAQFTYFPPNGSDAHSAYEKVSQYFPEFAYQV